jgi:hypothetical protein
MEKFSKLDIITLVVIFVMVGLMSLGIYFLGGN